MNLRSKTVFKECSHCKKQVAISYECQKCRLRICIICAIEYKWKCPECDSELL